MGVHCVYTPRGLTLHHWQEGLGMYAAAVAAGVGSSKRRQR